MAAWGDEFWKLSAELMNCVQKNDIAGARRIVVDITKKEDRKSIVAKRYGCNAPLFEAARRGTAKMVEFLVKECYADLEERGKYDGHGLTMPILSADFKKLGEYDGNELVTPLWCAAASGNLDAVEGLIELGADINTASTHGCTPLLYACDNFSPGMARYLIGHGADVQTPNKIGQTCLMSAVYSKNFCHLLIDNGADVKAQDVNGDLALHYAIWRNQPDTVQLLLDYGSDPYVENKAGDDAFRTASLKGSELILKELLFKLKPSVQRWIESYQLIGGYYVDLGSDTNKALHFWKEAVDVQQKNSDVEIIPSNPNPVYLFVKEVNTVEELEVLSWNRESIQMYALMIRERILGPNHNQTIQGLLDRGKSYKCNGEIRRCIDIWKYALHLQKSGVGQLAHQYLENFDNLCCLFSELFKVGRQSNHSVDQLSLIKDSLEVLEMATAMFELAVGNKHAEKNSKEETSFVNLILLLIKFITELDTNAYQECSFRSIVHRLVRCEPRTEQGRTLLHRLILPSTYKRLYIEYTLHRPSTTVVELLLECGANVNDVDDENNTAMHLCSKAIRNSRTEDHRDLMKRIAELLLKNGAHVDMVNISGDRAVDSLLSSLMEMNMLDFVSLRCLAARAVMKYKIPHVGHIPTSLESFVQMHGTPDLSNLRRGSKKSYPAMQRPRFLLKSPLKYDKSAWGVIDWS